MKNIKSLIMPMKKFSTLNFIIQKYQVESNGIDRKELSDGVGEQTYKAPEKSVKNILDFAFAYHTEKSKSTGDIELLLN